MFININNSHNSAYFLSSITMESAKSLNSYCLKFVVNISTLLHFWLYKIFKNEMDFMLLRMYTILLGLLKRSSLLILPELYREIFFRQPQRSVEIVGFFRQNGRDFVVV